MLKQIALVLSNPKYNSLIYLQQQTLVIRNQYIFLWSVLPKYSGKFTRKNQFVREMNTYGFELISQMASSNKQNSNLARERENQKDLVFQGRCKEYMTALSKIQEIKQAKISQKKALESKINSLKSKFQSIKQDPNHNIAQQFELFEEVSSLKNINRSIFALNQQLCSLLSSNFQIKGMNIGDQATFELLLHCIDSEKKGRITKSSMKSMNHLSALKPSQRI